MKMNIVMPRPRPLLGSFLVLILVTGVCIFSVVNDSMIYETTMMPIDTSNVTIFVITATHARLARMADMTRLANTLNHVSNILWIVVEDANKTVTPVRRLLDRSKIPYVYFAAKTPKGLPNIGNYQKNAAFDLIRKLPGPSCVVYIADDDNSYDLRLFDDYIRNVQTVGVWAVSMVGMALVEAPKVKKGKVVGFNVVFSPKRKFGVDMAGFAFNVEYILLNRNASFHEKCPRFEPETCFLEQLHIGLSDLQPFGYNDYPQDILVWHTQTFTNENLKGDTHGFFVEH